jgi:hypothetical protein
MNDLKRSGLIWYCFNNWLIKSFETFVISYHYKPLQTSGK